MLLAGVSCPALVEETDSHFTSFYLSWLYEDVISFACDVGYEHTGGDTTTTCQADGSWSGSPTQCTSMMFKTRGLLCFQLTNCFSMYRFMILCRRYRPADERRLSLVTLRPTMILASDAMPYPKNVIN